MLRKYISQELINIQRKLHTSIDEKVSHRVYTWGSGTHGQLGHTKFEEKTGVLYDKSYIQEEPRQLFKSGAFVQLACGSEFTISLSKKGELFGWGNGFFGDKKSTQPESIPQPIRMMKIAAGARHCAAIGENGLVYTWGKEGDWMKGGGHLGHGTKKSVEIPTLVEEFQASGAKAAAVCCGSGHTHILTTDGEILSCGAGEYGRLGVGSSSDALTPQSVDSLIDENMVQVVTGQSHSLALTEDGRVYSWGKNDNGQLGTPDAFMDMYSIEAYPRLLETDDAFEGHKIVYIAAGKARSAAVTEDGQLFIWGSKLTHTPTLIPSSAFKGLKVKKVVCGGEIGRSATAVITEDDTLWTFGDAKSYLLGRKGVSGNFLFREMPTPVRVPSLEGMKVLDVFAGLGQHMAAIVEKETTKI
eukprot:gene10425-21748_t